LLLRSTLDQALSQSAKAENQRLQDNAYALTLLVFSQVCSNLLFVFSPWCASECGLGK